MVQIDGAAALRCRAVVVEIGGRDYTINARPAADWMLVVLQDGWEDIVPGMLAGDLDPLFDALTDGSVTHDECQAAARDALSAAAGTQWWIAAKLLHMAGGDGAGMGELRLAGLDPGVVPLGAVIAALYRLYTREADRKQRAKFDAELRRPPPGIPAADVYDEDAAEDAFERAYAARG